MSLWLRLGGAGSFAHSRYRMAWNGVGGWAEGGAHGWTSMVKSLGRHAIRNPGSIS